MEQKTGEHIRKQKLMLHYITKTPRVKKTKQHVIRACFAGKYIHYKGTFYNNLVRLNVFASFDY